MNSPLAIVALLYVSGVLLGGLLSPGLPWLFAFSFGLAGATFVWSAARVYCLSLLAVLAGWTNLATRTEVISPRDLRTLVGTKVEFVTLRGTLCDTPSQRVYEHRDKESWRTLGRIDATALQRDARWQPAFGRVAVATPGVLGSNFFGGQTVEVTGVIRLPKGPAAEGLFDYRTYLRLQGIHYQLLVESTNDWRTVPTEGKSPRPPLADRFRSWSQNTLAAGLPNEDESLHLLWAMALGWTTALTDEVSEPFMRTGTMHIFAISGLHIALIAGILVSLLRVLQIPRGFCGWLVIPLIWFYTDATGWQSSAIRSTIMMSVIIVGWAIHRPSDLLNSLAAAGFIILLWDPQQLFQASFQLSFFVVLSIALLMPPIERLRQRLLQPDPLLPPELRPRWRRWLEGPVHFLTRSFATSLAACLGSLPLIAYYFHLFTPVSLAANLVIVPFSSLALMCNLGSLLCGGWCSWLNELFNHSGWFWMAAMVKFSDWFAALPGAYYYVTPPAPAVSIIYYTLLFGMVSGRLFAPRLRNWSVVAVCLLAAIGSFHWFKHRNDTRITVLPLSGGDSIFVDAPGRSDDLLLDCGNESAAEFLVKPFLHGQGVNQLRRLLLTHGDLRRRCHPDRQRVLRQRTSGKQRPVPFARLPTDSGELGFTLETPARDQSRRSIRRVARAPPRSAGPFSGSRRQRHRASWGIQRRPHPVLLRFGPAWPTHVARPRTRLARRRAGGGHSGQQRTARRGAARRRSAASHDYQRQRSAVAGTRDEGTPRPAGAPRRPGVLHQRRRSRDDHRPIQDMGGADDEREAIFLGGKVGPSTAQVRSCYIVRVGGIPVTSGWVQEW